MRDYTVYMVRERDTGRYFVKLSHVHGLRLVDWTYKSERGVRVDRREEAQAIADELCAAGYLNVEICVHAKGAQYRRWSGIGRCPSLSL